MRGLEISDLSFCEVAQEEDIEVKGGLSLLKTLNVGVTRNIKVGRLSSLIKELLTTELASYEHQPIPSNSEEYVVEKLENKTTGESGYIFSSKDGKLQTGMLIGQNSGSTFVLSMSHSSS